MNMSLAFGCITADYENPHLPPGPLFMGIDPGVTGAVAIIGRHFAQCWDIPTITVTRSGKTKKGNDRTHEIFNWGAIAGWFKILSKDLGQRQRLHVCVEKAQAMVQGKAPVSSRVFTAFKVGIAYGMWPLFLHAWEYPFEEYEPSQWKQAMGLKSKDKEFSRVKARNLFPKCRNQLARVGDHNRAEALLLAEYHRRQMGGA